MAGRRNTWLAALAGVAAGVVTIGVGSIVALLTGPTSDPLVAVGSAFVDATPAWLKDFAASTFGTADKLVLGIGEVVVLLALAALAGVLAERRWAWGPRSSWCWARPRGWPRWPGPTPARWPPCRAWSARSRGC